MNSMLHQASPIAEDLYKLIEAAAKAVGYEQGFGVTGCDLTKDGWWAAYIRQSMEEQAQNNRLPDYLRTCAQEAKKLGVVVPREYVIYDAVTGEHLERPGMIRLRRELVPGRRIAGVIFPLLDRLSREPIHIGIFEFELDHCGVRYHYGDAPNGSDPMAQMVRQNLAHVAKFVKLANRKGNRGGNVGRVLKGFVPAHGAPYGYRYRADRQIGSNGRTIILNAWWDVDEMGPDGSPAWGSPAWVVVQVFKWVAMEGRSLYWVATRLNESTIPAPRGGKWCAARLSPIIRRRCYTGDHAYNVSARVANPAKPLGDITAEIRRTVLQPKPEEDWVRYSVPALITDDLWTKANEVVTTRGRGRGKHGRNIQALLRSRLICPRCGRPMVVRRHSRRDQVYYHCSKYFRRWVANPCDYSKFVPGTWDDIVWNDICSLLSDDSWIERQMVSGQAREETTTKLVRLQMLKMSQAKAQIDRVRDGFDKQLYDVQQAKQRIAKYEAAIARSDEEIRRLRSTMGSSNSGNVNPEMMRRELKALRDRNLAEATFEERLELVARLGIKVHPAEDLRTMRVACQVSLPPNAGQQCAKALERNKVPVEGREPTIGCGKVAYAPPSPFKDTTA